MAFELYDADNYSDYDTSQLLREHVRVRSPADVSLVAGGRNGGGRLRIVGKICSSQVVAVRAISASPHSLAWGAYLTLTALPYPTFFCEVRDAVTGHVVFGGNPDGSIAAYRSNTGDMGNAGAVGSAVTLLGTSAPGLIAEGQAFAFKGFVTVSDTVGVVQVWLNGVEVLTLTGVDTRNESTDTITALSWGCTWRNSVSGLLYVEDFWCGSEMLPGDRRVDVHYPIADGADADWTPSAGGDHYAMVDEATPDDDTTTITATAVDSRDTFQVEDFKNPGGAIDGLVVVAVGKRADANSAQFATCVRSGGTTYDGTPIGITTIYEHHKQAYTQDPGTAAAWAEAAFGATGTAKFGVHKAA